MTAIKTIGAKVQEKTGGNHRSDYRILPQLLAGFAANLALLSAGMNFGWPAPSLPELLSEEATDPRLTSSEGAWVVSALMMGACLGPILSALLVNHIGRKWFLYSTAVPYLSCWVLIYFAKSFEWFFLARFIGGLGVGAVYSTVPIYLGEIAETRIRGALGTMSAAMVSCGTLICFSVGPWVSGKILALIGAIPCILFLLMFTWMPDTPYYHLRRKSLESAEKSLAWLRGTASVHEELKDMSNLVEAEGKHRGSIVDLFSVATNRRATLIIFILLSAQQFCGMIALLSYMTLLFERTDFGVEANLAVIITGVISFTVNIITTCIVDKLGRKPLLLVSACGTCLCMSTMAAYFHMEEFAMETQPIAWLPFAGVIGMYIFFALGLGPIPYAVLAEIYPTNVKAWATMVASIYGSVLGVAVAKTYQVVADGWGIHVIFYGFALSEFLFVVLILVLVPETKGKSFRDIQENLSSIASKQSSKTEGIGSNC